MILRRARWQLTFGFTGVQLLTYVILAFAVYAYVTTTFDFDGIEDGGSVATAETGFATLRVALILAFVGLTVVAPLSSWVLAGLAMRPVAATFAAQRRFVDDAAHELRTPLTAVQVQLELALRRPRTIAEYQEACRRALDAAHALTQTTNSLLLASENAHERASGDSIALADTLAEARALIPQPDRIRVEVLADPRVDASAPALRQVFINLFVNACRYSDAVVTVRVSAAGRRGVVEVIDAGIGMTRLEAKRAFDRFWQADQSRTGEGAGLGLSLVRDIVTSLRGDVRIQSTLGSGTTVRVRFPLSRSSHGALRSVESDGASRPKGK